MAAFPFKEKQRNKKIRARVVDMYSQIVSEVDPKDVFDLLIEKRVISIEQKQKFMIRVTRKERCRSLLDHLLYSSNDESFIVLREALEDQYPWIVERIDQCKTDYETTRNSDAKSDQNKMTQTENQEQSEDPVHVNMPVDEKERLKKEFDAAKSKLEIENRHLEQKLEKSKTGSKKLEQELQESRKEFAEMKDQYRILKETLDKAQDREKNSKKELDAIKSQTKLDIFGNLRRALGTASKNSAPQLRYSTSQKPEDSRKENETLTPEIQKSKKECTTFEQNPDETKTGSRKLEQELQQTKNLKQKLQESRNEITNLEQRLQESRKENKHFEQNLEESRKGNKNLEQKLEASGKERINVEQELEESRKETVEMKDQYRIVKETFDKAVDRVRNLIKELDSIKIPTKLGISGNIRKALGTTSKSSKPQLRRTTSSLESSKLFESTVFVFGIHDGISITQDIIKINLNRSEDVSEAQQIPVEMIPGSAAAVLCDWIFVTGIGEKCDEIWRFNATSSNWKKCASLVQCRLCHSVEFVDQVLYVCGGFTYYGKKTLLDDVEAYDTHKDQCVTVGKLAIAVYGSANCVPFKSLLYIFGGIEANDKIANKVQVYDTKWNTCTLLSKPMPRAECFLRAALLENTVLLLGHDCCLTYNFETQVWQVKHHFKTDVYNFGLIISNGLLLVIGGCDRKVDADGKKKWICRDDVRYIPLVNILKNEPIDWRHHATLPKPSLVHAFGKMDFG